MASMERNKQGLQESLRVLPERPTAPLLNQDQEVASESNSIQHEPNARRRHERAVYRIESV